MSTMSSVASILFPKSRQAVLGLLFSHPDQAYYLREIAQITGLGVGHVQREVGRLSGGGVIRRFEQGRHVYFQADETCPIYEELRGIVAKTSGAADVLRQSLSGMTERICFAFVYGSIASGDENAASDVDLMVVGDVTLAEIAGAVRVAEGALRRPVNSNVYPRHEFVSKLADGHHFLSRVMAGDKLMLIGDENDLSALS